MLAFSKGPGMKKKNSQARQHVRLENTKGSHTMWELNKDETLHAQVWPLKARCEKEEEDVKQLREKQKMQAQIWLSVVTVLWHVLAF